MTSTPEQTTAATVLGAAERGLADALLAEAFTTGPTVRPAPAAPAIPPGFRLVETVRPDGTTVREFIPQAATATPGEPAPAALPDATFPKPGRIPAWAYSTRALKTYCVLVATASTTALAVIYGPAIGAGLTEAAAGVWAAIVTAAKVLGSIALVLGLAYLFLPKNKNRAPRTGTFEGIVRGTWKED
ncbi:hypothetical protein [Streptomyces sp. NPDC002467]|uniref:hypothetical protein n=1 Tax=Streptomyces sp. NPDC002467 TaxID=3364647 RepID=UPI0036AAB083